MVADCRCDLCGEMRRVECGGGDNVVVAADVGAGVDVDCCFGSVRVFIVVLLAIGFMGFVGWRKGVLGGHGEREIDGWCWWGWWRHIVIKCYEMGWSKQHFDQSLTDDHLVFGEEGKGRKGKEGSRNIHRSHNRESDNRNGKSITQYKLQKVGQTSNYRRHRTMLRPNILFAIVGSSPELCDNRILLRLKCVVGDRHNNTMGTCPLRGYNRPPRHQ